MSSVLAIEVIVVGLAVLAVAVAVVVSIVRSRRRGPEGPALPEDDASRSPRMHPGAGWGAGGSWH